MTILPQASVPTDADLAPVVSTIPSLAPHPTNDNSNPQQGSGMLPESSPVGSLGPSVSSASTRSYSTKIPPTHKDSRKLFVGGLPADVTEQEFRDFFEQFGAVMDSVVMFDRDTHRSRGFGFVTFEDPAVCNRLLEMNDSGEGSGRLVMRGKTCEVKAAQPKESSMRGMARYGRQSNMGGGRSRGGMGAGQSKSFTPHNSIPQIPFHTPSDPALSTHGHVVGSIPYMQDPNMQVMYAPGHYGQYNGGSVYYPTSYSMAPMYYSNASPQASGAPYDPSSYGGHYNHHQHHQHEALETSPVRGLSHQSPMPLQPTVAQPQALAYMPYNVPTAYVAYPSSVMQPLAPGLPSRPEETVGPADGLPENGLQNRE